MLVPHLPMQASAGTAALAAAQAKAAGQLQVLDSQLASKEAGLAAAEARLQALGTELRSANSKVGNGHVHVSDTLVKHKNSLHSKRLA